VGAGPKGDAELGHPAHADAASRRDAGGREDGAKGHDARVEGDAHGFDARDAARDATARRDATEDAPVSWTAADAAHDAPPSDVIDACASTAEICNLADDDCNGYCDDVLGCRVGVDRSDDATLGLHFYTTTDSEASSSGYTVETFDYYYLYASGETGLVPFYRCLTPTSSHLYTTDPACEGNTSEGVMGYIATSGGTCGSVPLYRLDDATSCDHFYTTSMAEATSAEAGGYTFNEIAGYVWTADCGGPACTWNSPIDMVGSTTTAATGFPTVWYGFPIDGAQSFSSLSGTVSVTNSADLYSEVLFILLYLASGDCISGHWPSSTPEYGPPGAASLAQFIVKAPTTGTFSVPIDFSLPGGLPISGCVLMGLNGGTVATSHDVTAAATLSLAFTPPEAPAQSLALTGGEFCFGMNGGCQGSTTDDSQSFATVTPITSAMNVVALYGDISDSTFDGTSSFGPLPTGAWTATNDFYVYHGADCSSLGVASGIAGPGDFYGSIPADATHLLSVPLSGNGIGVSETQVFQALSTPVAAGDCFVTLWGLQGNGAFDNETQVFTLLAP
jgi:hypothetical protein